jgi:proline iminopeptidase
VSAGAHLGASLIPPPQGHDPSRWNVIHYDQRGCGRSTRPIDRFSSPSFFDHIERIRTILGGDKLVLIGHSFGGFLASPYAAEFPQHVKALVLVARPTRVPAAGWCMRCTPAWADGMTIAARSSASTCSALRSGLASDRFTRCSAA